MSTEEVFFYYWKWLGEQGACLLTGSAVLFLLEKLSLDEESFHHFCLEFLCFLGKAIRKLVRKATLVASRILRFPWLNPSGFSPKYSRQAALLALINYIFQMIDQGTVMYTNRFWCHLTLDSVAFWVVVTLQFVPTLVDYLFTSALKEILKETFDLALAFDVDSFLWVCSLVGNSASPEVHKLAFSGKIMGLLPTQLYLVLLPMEKCKRKSKLPFWHIVSF